MLAAFHRDPAVASCSSGSMNAVPIPIDRNGRWREVQGPGLYSLRFLPCAKPGSPGVPAR